MEPLCSFNLSYSNTKFPLMPEPFGAKCPKEGSTKPGPPAELSRSSLVPEGTEGRESANSPKKLSNRRPRAAVVRQRHGPSGPESDHAAVALQPDSKGAASIGSHPGRP